MFTNHARIFVLAAAMLVAACGPKKTAQEPSAQDFAPYIKAYTGGIITADTPLRIDLAENATATPTEGLFTIKPVVKGEVRWDGSQSVSFIPADGALREGLVYQVKFALGKLIPGAPETFSYGITVKGKAPEPVPEEAEPDNGESFRVVQATLAETCIEVELSEAPANARDKGMVELEGAARSYVQVQGSLLRVHFENRKGDLTLTLDKGLKDENGNTLTQDYVKVFREKEEKPAVKFPFKGNILPDKQQLIIPFNAVNLSAVEVRVIKIYEQNILMFLQDNNLGTGNSLRRSGRLIYKADVPLDATKDLHQWNTHSLDLSGLFKQEPGAIYRIRLCFRMDQSLYGGKEILQAMNKPSGKPSPEEEAAWDSPEPYYWDNFYDWSKYNWKEADDPEKPSYYMDGDRFPACQLISSDLGLMAEYAGGKELWVAATDLITADPVYGASVEVYDYQLQSIGKGKTNESGLATIAISRTPFAVVAKAGGSSAYLKVTDGSQRSMSRFDVGGEVLKEGIKAFIYGERGVWRPGDTLHVTAIVADKGRTLPEAHPATLEVYTPAGQFYGKFTRKGTDGFFSFDVPTKADDPTGYWNAYLKVGGSSFHKVLHIETVKPNRLKVNTSFPSVLEAGKTIQVPVSAAWLSGGVAGNLPVRAKATLKKVNGSPFKGFEKYIFTQPSSGFSADEQVLFEGRLDAGGALQAQVKLPAAQNAPGMLQAFITTSVEEPGGDESFTTETLPYSPYSSYVGIRIPDGEFLETDQKHSFQLVVVDPQGKKVKGHKVEYAVYKAGWNWWWDNAGGTLDAYVNGSSVTKVKGGTATVGAEGASFSFQVNYPEWGRYVVLARDTQSGHVSGAQFTVDWPEYSGRAGRRDPEALTMITLSTDKPSYTAGEKATVYIPAAPGGKALVELTNTGGVLSREWVSTSDKDTPWTFTVSPDMAPNIYVQVTLLQPYGASANDLPLRLYGVQRVKVENAASHLEPVVQMPDVLHPEEPFLIKVSEKNGKPMTYTLALVDEGLLDLTAFKTPDPWSRMYRSEALTVNTWDLYDQVIGAFSGRFSPLAAIGGDEDAVRSARKDNRFNPVVLYKAPKTLEKGTDILKLQLPMYVGSVRLMLIAGHDGAYGKLEKTVPVQNPLMVVTTLPRVMGTGETTQAAVNVFAMEDKLGEATITVKADGPLQGGGTQKVTFSTKGDRLLRFPLTAGSAEGISHITVTASGGGHKATETVALEVRNPNPVRTNVERMVLEPGASASVNGNTLQLATLPAMDVRSMFLFIKNYPYSCAEQLSARGLTLLHLMPFLPEADAKEARALIPGLIKMLYSRQQADGGFAYWEGGTSDSWVSSMAGQFLSEASRAGFEVNAGVVKRWKSFQEKLSQAYRAAGKVAFSDLDEAYRLYTLAVAGAANLSGMNRLRSAEDLSDQARWALASAYALSGKASLSDALLDGTQRTFPEYEFNELTFGTTFRDRMLAVDALALCGRVADAFALMQDMPDRVLSTQESTFAAIAYHHLSEKAQSGALHAKVGEEDAASAGSVLTRALSGPTTVKNLSDGKLYATILTETREPAAKAVSNGLEVNVKYVGENGAAISPATLSQGTRLSAIITVKGHPNRSLKNLALSMGIPSGWEIVNERLTAGASAEDGYDFKDIRDDRVDWFFALPAGRSKTFRVQLRAAYEGTYTLPAVHCEAMYDATVNASSASGKAVVTE